ncbi:MAG: HEAT repeat domain-containing protein [Acidobacteria bacterium]|nr:HEAT repeat domain-containing protein [Acidobacteriota bacterium]
MKKRQSTPEPTITSRLFNPRSLIVPAIAVILILLSLLSTACGRYKARRELARTRFFAEILKREDSRWLGYDEFFENNLLDGDSPEYSKWCAIALGRIANPRALPLLYRALNSNDADVRAASAFAIGEIEDREQLSKRYLESDPEAIVQLLLLLGDPSLSVQMRAVEALGKVGSQREAAEIVRRLERFSYRRSPYEHAYLSTSIAALARLKDSVAVPLLERLVHFDDSGIRWRALDALMHIQSKTSESLFIKNLQHSNPDVQSIAACGMGIVGDVKKAGTLFPLLLPQKSNTGERIPLPVRICALRSLGMMKNRAAASAVAAAVLAEPSDALHPDQLIFVSHAAVALGDIGSGESEALLLSLLKLPGAIADNAAISLAKILRGKAERFFQLVEKYRLNGQISESAWVRAMAEIGGPEAAEELNQMLERAVKSTSASDRQILPDILAALAKTGATGSQEIWALLLRIRDCAALPAAVAAYPPQPGTTPPWTPAIDAFAACSSSSNVRARLEILSHLQPWVQEKEAQQLLWTGLKDPERKVRSLSADLLRKAGITEIPREPDPSTGAITDAISMAIAETRRNSTIAQIETTRGIIEIELFREDAPLTVHSFVMLAKQGIYDGMELARGFPFRIEGKIPRSRFILGRTINSEINMRPFERGSIGMAASGENSDAGEIFIALAPQPHLDGTHTCFGRIVSGLQLADKMGPGDRILRIHIKETISFQNYRRYVK